MKFIELSNSEVMNFLSNKHNQIGQGNFGLLCKYDETTLIKLYYKDFFQAYYTLDSQIFDDEINSQLDIIETCKELNIDHTDKSKKLICLYNHLQFTDSHSLIKGIVTYKNYIIGVLLEYYKEYETLTNIFSKVSLNNQKEI